MAGRHVLSHVEETVLVVRKSLISSLFHPRDTRRGIASALGLHVTLTQRRRRLSGSFRILLRLSHERLNDGSAEQNELPRRYIISFRRWEKIVVNWEETLVRLRPPALKGCPLVTLKQRTSTFSSVVSSSEIPFPRFHFYVYLTSIIHKY